MSEFIILQEGQSGYDIVAEYVLKYWDKTYYSTAIVSLETSYDGIIYDKHNEVVSSSCGDFEEFSHDWWEGQKFIKINGVKNIDEIEFVPTADVIAVVRCRDCKHNEDNGGDCNRTITHISRNYVCEVNEYKYIGLEYCSYGERSEQNER